MARGIIDAQRAKQSVKARKYTQRTLSDLERGRYVLQNRRQVRRSAAGKSGYLASTGQFDYYKGDYWEGYNLKKGVEGMAERVSEVLTDEELAKIRAMGSEELSALYQNNRFVFEVAFDYGGIDKTSRGSYSVSESKADDMRFLIQQYERFYGEIAI